MRSTDLDLLYEASKHFDIDLRFLFSLAQLESDFNPYACRYERRYRWFYKPHLMARRIGCTNDTMYNMMKTSYGLLQVMGGNLYEIGGPKYYDSWPTELMETEVNLEIGCTILQKIKKKYKEVLDIYACYNAGSVVKIYGEYQNQQNVTKFADVYVAMPSTYDKMIQHVTQLAKVRFDSCPLASCHHDLGKIWSKKHQSDARTHAQ